MTSKKTSKLAKGLVVSSKNGGVTASSPSYYPHSEPDSESEFEQEPRNSSKAKSRTGKTGHASRSSSTTSVVPLIPGRASGIMVAPPSTDRSDFQTGYMSSFGNYSHTARPPSPFMTKLEKAKKLKKEKAEAARIAKENKEREKRERKEHEREEKERKEREKRERKEKKGNRLPVSSFLKGESSKANSMLNSRLQMLRGETSSQNEQPKYSDRSASPPPSHIAVSRLRSDVYPGRGTNQDGESSRTIITSTPSISYKTNKLTSPYQTSNAGSVLISEPLRTTISRVQSKPTPRLPPSSASIRSSSYEQAFFQSRQMQYNQISPREQAEQDQWAVTQINAATSSLGECAEGAFWHRVLGGYQCSGHSHFMADAFLAEGRGGHYVRGFVPQGHGTLLMDGCVWGGPFYIEDYGENLYGVGAMIRGLRRPQRGDAFVAKLRSMIELGGRTQTQSPLAALGQLPVCNFQLVQLSNGTITWTAYNDTDGRPDNYQLRMRRTW